MLLRRLRDYSERLALPPVRYLSTPIRWVIDLDAEGRLLTVIPTPGEGGKGRGSPMLAPHLGRTVAVLLLNLFEKRKQASRTPNATANLRRIGSHSSGSLPRV